MKKTPLLILENLSVDTDGREILHRINLSVNEGEVHAIMGPNGSGKSTLLYALMGHPVYNVKPNHANSKSRIIFNNIDISSLATQERARLGIFLAIQQPIAIPGVSVIQIIRSALEERTIKKNSAAEVRQPRYNPILLENRSINGISLLEFNKIIQSTAQILHIDKGLLTRGIHDGFSGGERKKIEILEALMLNPRLALFDEIDTGLDVDALKSVAEGIRELNKRGTTVILVTHYQRILRFVKPDKVHVLVKGSIIKHGGGSLAKLIDKKGYARYAEPISAS